MIRRPPAALTNLPTGCAWRSRAARTEQTDSVGATKSGDVAWASRGAKRPCVGWHVQHDRAASKDARQLRGSWLGQCSAAATDQTKSS